MHELSLVLNMVESLEQVMLKEKASKLLCVTVELGSLSGVEKEPLAFCFPMAVKGTSLEGAELIIEDVPLTVDCRKCGVRSCPEFPAVFCESCGGFEVDIVLGRDFKIKTIEVE